MILVQLVGLTVWVQGSEIDLQGIEKANEAMEKQKQAAMVSFAALAESGSIVLVAAGCAPGSN